ncbi:MAG TPA: peptidylprolyl isomerase [Longimicrobium sp.]|nr:peptidylprolyl isomerase [Longimicrobium sp.]
MMRNRFRIGSRIAVLLLAAGCGPSNPQVELRTQFGNIRIEVDSVRAPRTAANFLRYVDEGRLDSASFYRVRREEAELMQRGTAVVQGGLWRSGDTTKFLPPIPLESTRETGLRHTDGVVSLARFGVNSGRGEFFIVVGDQPHLDYRGADKPGYAAFGRVVEGMDLVRDIQRLPVRGEQLARPIPFSASRVR